MDRMSVSRLGVAFAIALAASSGIALAKPGDRGGGPHVGGGAPHFGGGAPHIGGMHLGGMPHGGGFRFAGGPRSAPHFAAPRFGGGGLLRAPHVASPHFGGHHFAAAPRHVAMPRSFARPGFGGVQTAHQHNNAPHLATLHARTMQRVLNAHASARYAGALRDPHLRAAVAATAATAAWRGARHVNLGWWRHGNGGYGWVGPLFWPFAYYDLYDYALWGPVYGVSFWDYGYDDIYAGIFAPYDYDALSGYLPRYAALGRSRRARSANDSQLAQLCNADGGDIAGIPAEQIEAAIQLSAEQRTALEDLANASIKAAQIVRAACPTDIALTAPGRLGLMQQRVEAMLTAIGTLQPPLQKFYDSLNDEQKARFGALIDEQRRSDRRRAGPQLAAGPDCGMAQAGVLDWPSDQIERKVRPTDAQRDSLAALQDAAAKAADMMKTSCQPDSALTLPARLAAMKDRLTVMLEAVKTVRTALDGFYATLSDEQKAQFESIGRERVG